MPSESDKRVWWIPQVPMKSFKVPVNNLQDAMFILDTLGRYDQFQLDNNIKPDYSNVGGLEIFENGEWCEWSHDKTGEDIQEYRESTFDL